MSNILYGALRSNIKLLKQTYRINQNAKPLLQQNISVGSVRYVVSQKGDHRPSTLEKYLLVWMKKYPSVSEVPSTVSRDVMEKTRNWARIKINILTCILTAVVCVFMVYSGKQAAKRGESITKMNKDWHKEQNAQKE